MTSHDEYAALLDAFLDGELSEAEAREVRAHLSECADCQAYVADALAMRDAFPDIEETVVPEGFAESVLAALPPRRVSWRAHWAKIVLPLAACAALVILLHGTAGRRAPGGGASMIEEAVTTGMDAGGADTVPPQAPELYGAAESQSVWNATADKTEPDMTPFAMRSSGTEAPEESVSNGSAAPAAAKAIPDGYAVEETFPDEVPATNDGETRAEAVPDGETETKAVPGGETKAESVPDAETKAGEFPEGDIKTDEFSESVDVKELPPKPEPGVNEVTLLGESGEKEETTDFSADSLSMWTLPAEALDLFDDYAPAEKTESGIWYALTPEEFDALSGKIARMGMEIVSGADAPPSMARPGMEYVFVPL